MWQVRIEGDAPDINDIEQVLPRGGALRVERIGDGRYLAGQRLDEASDASAALRAARRLLDILNVAARLADSGHRPVKAGVVRDDSGNHFLFVDAELALSSSRAFAPTITKVDDPPSVRQRTVAELMLDLDDVPELSEVVQLLLSDRSPVGMYKVYEVVKANLGRDPSRFGLVSAAELKRFTHSMNDPSALGERARHARLGTTPPKLPMYEAEALAFTDALVRRWVEKLAADRDIPLTAPVESD